MPDAALTRAGRLQLAVRRCLDRVRQLLDVLVRARRIDLDAGRILVHQRERRVAGRIEFGEALMVHHRDLDRDHADGVAVGRRGRDRRMADDAGAAGAVDHVERLTEVLLENGGDDARGGVGAAAGAPRTDHRHRARRPGLRACGHPGRSIEAAPAAALAASNSRRVSLVMASSLLFCRRDRGPLAFFSDRLATGAAADKKADAPDEIAMAGQGAAGDRRCYSPSRSRIRPVSTTLFTASGHKAWKRIGFSDEIGMSNCGLLALDQPSRQLRAHRGGKRDAAAIAAEIDQRIGAVARARAEDDPRSWQDGCSSRGSRRTPLELRPKPFGIAHEIARSRMDPGSSASGRGRPSAGDCAGRCGSRP